MNGVVDTVRTQPAPAGRVRRGREQSRIETTVALTGEADCIAGARRFTGEFLTRVQRAHGIPVCARTLDLAGLVVSELVTNALRHAPGPALLQLRVADTAVEIAVWDSDPALPRPLDADPTRVGRHGLEIVRAVAAFLGIFREPVGKRIVARLALLDGR